MRGASLILAAATLVVSNGMLLVHAARNRLATESELTLTQRELRYWGPYSTDENNGMALHLDWTELSALPWPDGTQTPVWLGPEALTRVGFDCRTDPSAPDADNYYTSQRPRKAYIALEFEGPAWRNWLETYQRAYDEAAPRKPSHTPLEEAPSRTHLIAVDADADPGALRARHPDRSVVMILPGVIELVYQGYMPMKVIGRIHHLSVLVHVPRPYSDGFDRVDRGQLYSSKILYRVRLRVGALYEPWVAGVDIP